MKQRTEVEVPSIKLVNKSTGQVIAGDVQKAYTFWSRFKGLMLAKKLPDNRAIHIAPCTSIHTFFMKFSIDSLYLSKENEIIGIEENLAPGKIGKRFSNAGSVIELPAGWVKRTSTEVGQVVEFVDEEDKQAI